MKRWMSILFAALIVVIGAMPAAAARPANMYPITFNGHPVLFEVAPEVTNGVTFVPFRAIFEKMGAEVTFDNGNITATRDGKTVKLAVGSTSATVDGQSRSLAAAPVIKNSRTLVPLRFVGEAFGATVNYNPATTAISIVDANWPRRGGDLNLAMWNKPNGDYNPIIVSDTYGSYFTGLMYDGMWRYDERFVPVPAVAESWEWSNGGTKLTFYLRKDVKRYDGTPVTAKDFVFTYKAIWHPKYIGPRDTGWQDVKGYSDYAEGKSGETPANFANGIVTTGNLPGLYAPDDHTLVFELTKPNSPFLFNITFGAVDPTDYASIPVQDWGTARDPHNASPNGYGAFKPAEFVEGSYAIFTANDSYWAGRPYVNRVVWRVIDASVAIGEVKNGDIDFAEFAPADLEAYQAMSNVKINEFPALVYQEMRFNTQEGPTAEKAVRQAVSYAIDRQAIITNLMKDHGSTMYTPIHPLTFGYTDDVEQYDYNPAKAGQILDQAGWAMGSDGFRYKNGEKLSLELVFPLGNKTRENTAPVVQQWLKAIGVEIRLAPLDWGTLNTKVFTDYDFDMYFIGFQLGNSDPDGAITGTWDKASAEQVDSFNGSRWWTAKSEQLMDEGRATGDIEERIEIYAQWSQHWADEAPGYIFYAVNTMIAANERLQNFKPGPQGELWNIEELWLSK